MIKHTLGLRGKRCAYACGEVTKITGKVNGIIDRLSTFALHRDHIACPACCRTDWSLVLLSAASFSRLHFQPTRRRHTVQRSTQQASQTDGKELNLLANTPTAMAMVVWSVEVERRAATGARCWSHLATSTTMPDRRGQQQQQQQPQRERKTGARLSEACSCCDAIQQWSRVTYDDTKWTVWDSLEQHWPVTSCTRSRPTVD